MEPPTDDKGAGASKPDCAVSYRQGAGAYQGAGMNGLPMTANGTARHFGAMRNLVAIGAKRTSTKPRQSSSVYEYAP